MAEKQPRSRYTKYPLLPETFDIRDTPGDPNDIALYGRGSAARNREQPGYPRKLSDLNRGDIIDFLYPTYLSDAARKGLERGRFPLLNRTLADQITRILSTPAEQFSGPSGYRTPANLNEGGTFSTPAAQGTGLGILATPSEQGGVTGFADPIQQALGGTWQADWVEGPGRSGKFTGKLTPEQRKFLDQLGGKLGTVNVTDPYGQTGPMQDITWEKNVMANPQLRDIAAALGYTQGSRPDIEQW